MRVCIVHVGGTIGMVTTERGLVPQYGFVERYLTTMRELSQPDVPEWELLRLDPLLDSANMFPGDWVRVAGAIVDRYDDYDGFVVLHGTDTMVYTASALSFLLRGLSKPIVFTGSQLPLQHPRSDGREHVITSLILAAMTGIPEVGIYFGGELLRGNRSQKVNNDGFTAYASGNLEPLARIGVAIDVNEHLVRPAGDGELATARLLFAPSVGSIRVFPGISAEMLDAMLAPLEGVVLETYGAGTFPSRDSRLLVALERAVERGVVVVNCSQCLQGRVRQELYGTGRVLAELGVVSGHDMTPEAALTKLYCLLGAGGSVDSVRRDIQKDLAGEISV